MTSIFTLDGDNLVLDLTQFLESDDCNPAVSCSSARKTVVVSAYTKLWDIHMAAPHRTFDDCKNTCVELPTWVQTGIGAPISALLSQRALVRAYRLLIPLDDQEAQYTTLGKLSSLADDPVSDRMEDAMRLAEVLAADTDPCSDPMEILFGIEYGMSLLHVRETGDDRGRGLYARVNLSPKFVNTLLTPFPSLRQLVPCEGSIKWENDSHYAVGDSMQPTSLKYRSYYYLDRSGTLGIDALDLPIGQFANEPVAGTLESHNAMITRHGIVLLKPVVAGEQILVCYGATGYNRAWDMSGSCLESSHCTSMRKAITPTNRNDDARRRTTHVNITAQQAQDDYYSLRSDEFPAPVVRAGRTKFNWHNTADTQTLTTQVPIQVSTEGQVRPNQSQKQGEHPSKRQQPTVRRHKQLPQRPTSLNSPNWPYRSEHCVHAIRPAVRLLGRPDNETAPEVTSSRLGDTPIQQPWNRVVADSSTRTRGSSRVVLNDDGIWGSNETLGVCLPRGSHDFKPSEDAYGRLVYVCTRCLQQVHSL